MSIVVAVVFAVEVGAVFGGAAATAVPSGPDLMEVELVVNVAAGDAPVLAHLVLPGDPRSTYPLVDRGGGTWSSVVEVRRADWQVVFEAVTSGDLSEPASLTALGVDPDLLRNPVPASAPSPQAAPATPWGLASLASGAAGFALLLYLYASGSVRPRHLR